MNKMLLSAALAGIFTAGVAVTAHAADDAKTGKEKCYGIAKELARMIAKPLTVRTLAAQGYMLPRITMPNDFKLRSLRAPAKKKVAKMTSAAKS